MSKKLNSLDKIIQKVNPIFAFVTGAIAIGALFFAIFIRFHTINENKINLEKMNIDFQNTKKELMINHDELSDKINELNNKYTKISTEVSFMLKHYD